MAISNWKKVLTVAASVSVLGMALAGCGTSNSTNSTSQSSGSSKPVEGGNIVLDTTQQIRDLDPAKAYDTASAEVVDQLYDRLLTYAPGQNNPTLVPMAAKALPTVSSDGLTYTFHLRTDMKFWNGDPVTAQSFIDEIQRVATKSMGSGGESFISAIKGVSDFYAGKVSTISGLSAPDKYTLKIQLTQPDAKFQYELAMPFFSAVDQKYINKVGEKAFDTNKAMGSGPFELQAINANEDVLVKNPNYWQKDKWGQQMPYLDKVTIRINTNAQLDALNFEQGKTAFLGMDMSIPTSSFPHFQTTPSLKQMMVKYPQNSVFYLGLNNNIAPFNNAKVRQAVNYAIDKQRIVKLLNGRAIAANQPLPPGLKGYQSSLPSDATYSYNPTKAKQMLKAAGVKSGTTITVDTYNDPTEEKIAQSIQQDLDSVGFKAKLSTTTWATFLNKEESGTSQAFTSGWLQDFPDAQDFLFLFESDQAPVNNSSMYKNKQVDQWLKQANSSTDPNQRIQLFGKITDEVMKDAPWVPLYYPISYAAVQPWVHGWYAPAVLMDPFQSIWIDKGHSATN